MVNGLWEVYLLRFPSRPPDLNGFLGRSLDDEILGVPSFAVVSSWDSITIISVHRELAEQLAAISNHNGAGVRSFARNFGL
jgi:hypothetical protein